MPNPFDSGLDDYMFPTTQSGFAATGMVLESATMPGKGHIGPLGVLENAVDEDARIRNRTNAMSAVLSWIAEGDYTYNSLDVRCDLNPEAPGVLLRYPFRFSDVISTL